MPLRLSTYNTNVGLLLLRMGLGFSMLYSHGWGKITAGPEFWGQAGQVMKLFGIDFLPVFWGFMSAFAESVCALLVILGLFFKPALLLLIINMSVVLGVHLITGDGISWFAMVFTTGWVALFFAGPGRYNLDTLLFSAEQNKAG